MNTKFNKSAYGYFLIWGVCASLAMTVCTIVDAILIGNFIGSSGLAVTNISTPVFLIYALFGITIGVGANVHIGRLLGASDIEGANHLFRAQLTTGLIIGAFCLTSLLFKDVLFKFLGVTQELYPLAEQYLTVVLCSAPMFIIYHILSCSVRTDSDPKLLAISAAVVICTNLSLDLIFMRVFNLGIIGASASLCIAVTLGVLVLLTHFLKKRSLLKLRLTFPNFSDIKKFVVNGFGMGSANVFQAVVMLIFNTLLLKFCGEMGVIYVAIYGVIYTISTIPFSIFDGSSNAISTVTAFLVGESDTDGIFIVLKRALKIVIIFGILLTITCVVLSNQLVHFFGLNDSNSVEIAKVVLRIFSISTLFTGINTIVTAFWQSIGKAKLAGIISIIRNCVLMLSIGILLIYNNQIVGLGFTYVCTEILCTIIILCVLSFGSSKKYVCEEYGVKGKCFENNYIIEIKSMEQISGDLQRLCDEWEIGMKQAFFINFICEELLLNIIKFGLDDKRKEYYISIKLMEKDGGYVLRVRDNVNLYNPFESNGDEIDSGVLELIRKKSKYCDYQRKMIFNYLYVVI